MKLFIFSICLIFPLVLCAEIIHQSDHCITLKKKEDVLSIGTQLNIVHLPANHKVTPNDFYSGTYTNSVVPTFPATDEDIWAFFKVKNLTSSNDIVVLIDYALMDEIELYEIKDQKLILIEKAGDNFSYNSRKIKTTSFVLKLPLNTNETKNFAFRFSGKDQLILPIFVMTYNNMAESEWVKNLIVGLCLGVLLVMFFYNLFLYIYIQDKSYLLYILYILFIGLAQASLLGYPFKYLWPSLPVTNNNSLYIFSSLSGIFAIMFLRNFMLTKINVPLLDKFAKAGIGIYAVVLILISFGLRSLSSKFLDGAGIYSCILFIAIGIILSIRGIRTAKFFLIAWSTFLSGIVIFILRNIGIIEFSNFSNYTMLVGASLEATFLSLALADRINILKREKVESQQEAIRALQENKRLITLQNTELESKVKQRTFELESAYKNLQNTQSQLVDSEKMASLGQLTAGIAHEINNPINFVVSNITPLRRDINDILELVEKYEKITKENGLEENLIEIRKFRKEIDVDFVKQEIDMLLNGISEGASRTSEIIRSLRNFSRVDESDLKTANINEGILSTLVLLSQQFDKITVIKNIGDIPKIDCYPGKLNQAFMNILTNAIQALQKTESARIEISTSLVNEDVVISIKDNGSGMTEEIRAKIFDPFFTTKDVGKGTGLGLSITYGIIEKHKGKIEVNSVVGLGTEFVLTLPVKRHDLD